ncbi:acyltransferase family protein [Dyella caseinilytica]|uniref:Acyltransferase n=1 Tax=Dyella caseinilytica TaxID=1849581 RepID=A0ABX7GZB3_9GAMM|nr:acyltransferase [Dyella caseinilytica]QRN55164.1 acyltransferase [Dyella caseinilytica]GFZ99818.1 acyltransferase [Dyella caseinilytica]
MNRLSGLDLLRAIAILWVMLFHSWIVGGLGDPFQPIGDYGWMGVDLFFVLSGYLIGYQVLKPLSLRQPLHFAEFYRRRTYRILPAFLVVLAVYAWFPSWREAPGMQPAWQFLTFTLNLLIDYQHNEAFSHAWSLCVEEQFYLVFPALAWLLTRRPSLPVTLCVGSVIVAAGMLLRAYAARHNLDYLENIYYPTYTRLDGLLAGVTLAAIQAYRPSVWSLLQRNGNILTLIGLAVVGIAIWLFRDRLTFMPSVFGFPLLSFGIALLVAACAGRQGLGRWRVPGTGWIAGMSYSLYLSHKLALHAVARWLAAHPAVHGWVAFVLYAVAITLLGTLLHYGVEQPFLRLRDRRAASRMPAAIGQADVSAG